MFPRILMLGVEDRATCKEHPLRIIQKPLSSLALEVFTEESPVQTLCSRLKAK